MMWTLGREEFGRIKDRAEMGISMLPDTHKLIGRVQQLEAACEALKAERDIAAGAAVESIETLRAMRELRDSDAQDSTKYAGFIYYLGEGAE